MNARVPLTAPRLLVVRNDGLGDFILTLPLIASLKRQLPDSRVTVLINEALVPLVPLLPDIDGVIADPGVLLKRHRGRYPPKEAARLREDLENQVREGRFDAAVLVYAEAASARLVHRAAIPLRAGPLRRPFFWRFNAYFRQSRKEGRRPEYLLNLGYLPLLGLDADYQVPRLAPPQEANPPSGRPKETYALLHPHKRSGTALSWPLENFQELARELMAGGRKVVIIGDEGDRMVLENNFGDLPGVRLEIGLSLPRLTSLISGAACFIGNSSGPLHLAALTGTPHVAFFPQDRVSSPDRWRTLPHPGDPPDFRNYLLASRFPVNCVVCAGNRCPYFNCVASIGLDAVKSGLAAWGLNILPKASSEGV